MKRPKQQFLSARLLCRVMRAGWGPVPPDAGRLVSVFYPPGENMASGRIFTDMPKRWPPITIKEAIDASAD